MPKPPSPTSPAPSGAAGDDAGRAARRRSPRPAASDASSPATGADAAADPQPACDRADLEATLRLAAEGDARAWRELIEAYSGRVFGLIRAQCGSSDLAEEITQSTFCTVVAKIGSYTELGRFEQWLFRIAMNRLRDEMRRRKRQARPVEDEALISLAEDETAAGGPRAGASREGQGERLGGAAELRALRGALTQLSDADQQIIHLRHNAGLSFKQIAEVLEQPLGTVLARQHRALKKLGELLRATLGRDHPLLAELGAAGESSGDSAGAETRGPREPEGRSRPGGARLEAGGPEIAK